MGFRGYRTAAKPQEIARPAAVALVAIAGILVSMAIFGLAVALMYVRTTHGLALTNQILEIGVSVAIALFLLWIYWGTWDLVPSSWWAHVTIGPVFVIALLLLLGFAPTAANIVANGMLKSEIAQTEMVIRVAAITLAVIEGAAIVAMLSARQAFQIGVKKPIWEQANR